MLKSRESRLRPTNQTLSFTDDTQRNPDGTLKGNIRKDPLNELEAWLRLTHAIDLDNERAKANATKHLASLPFGYD